MSQERTAKSFAPVHDSRLPAHFQLADQPSIRDKSVLIVPLATMDLLGFLLARRLHGVGGA